MVSDSFSKEGDESLFQEEENVVLQSARANKRNLESQFLNKSFGSSEKQQHQQQQQRKRQHDLSASTDSTSSIYSDSQSRATPGIRPHIIERNIIRKPKSESAGGNDQQVEQQKNNKTHIAQHIYSPTNQQTRTTLKSSQQKLIASQQDESTYPSRPQQTGNTPQTYLLSESKRKIQTLSRSLDGKRWPEVGANPSLRPPSRKGLDQTEQIRSQNSFRHNKLLEQMDSLGKIPLTQSEIDDAAKAKARKERGSARWITRKKDSLQKKTLESDIKQREKGSRIGAQWVKQQENSIENKVRRSDDPKSRQRDSRLGAQWIVQQENSIEAKARAKATTTPGMTAEAISETATQTTIANDTEIRDTRDEQPRDNQWFSKEVSSQTAKEKQAGRGSQWVPLDVTRQLDRNIERKRSGLSRIPIVKRINKGVKQPEEEKIKLSSIDENQSVRHLAVDRSYIPTQQNNALPGPSNIVIDDSTSLFTQETGHSTATVRIRNSTEVNDQRSGFNDVVRSHNSDSSKGSIHLPSRGSIPLSLQVYQTNPPDRRHSNHSPRILINMMDDQGRTMTLVQMQNMWKRQGRCSKCGLVQTHQLVQGSLLNFRRLREPLTEDGLVYEGYCLICHSVSELRNELDKDDIPDDLFRISESELREKNPKILEDPYGSVVVTSTTQKSPIQLLTSNPKFQVCMGICTILSLGFIVLLLVLLTKFEPFESQAPTSSPSIAPSMIPPSQSPTLVDWFQIAEIVPPPDQRVESFGYTIQFDAFGKRLAVSAPLAHDRKGQITVYSVFNDTYQLLGEPIIGDTEGDLLGLGMHISQGGDRLAVGYPGNKHGFVRVFQFSPDLEGWIQYGQTLMGPSLLSSFGQAVSLNYNGDILVVGAPGHSSGEDRHQNGLVRVFKDTKDNSMDQKWIQVGDELIGEFSGDRFGNSLSVDDTGRHFVVGAPKNSLKWENAGSVYWYQKTTNGEYEILQEESIAHSNKYDVSHVTGDGEGFQLGTKCVISIDGTVFTTNAPRASLEGIRSAGLVASWSYDTYQAKEEMGKPIFGSEVDEGLGSDFDALRSHEMIAMSGRNKPTGETGAIKVYSIINGNTWLQFGGTIQGPNVGGGEFLGNRPSVAMTSSGIYLKGTIRVAVGYQSVAIGDELAKPMIAVYSFTGLAIEAEGQSS